MEKLVTSELLNFFVRFVHLITYSVAIFYDIHYLYIAIPFLRQTISPTTLVLSSSSLSLPLFSTPLFSSFLNISLICNVLWEKKEGEGHMGLLYIPCVCALLREHNTRSARQGTQRDTAAPQNGKEVWKSPTQKREKGRKGTQPRHKMGKWLLVPPFFIVE